VLPLLSRRLSFSSACRKTPAEFPLTEGVGTWILRWRAA
jgi:hypothetical protein